MHTKSIAASLLVAACRCRPCGTCRTRDLCSRGKERGYMTHAEWCSVLEKLNKDYTLETVTLLEGMTQ